MITLYRRPLLVSALLTLAIASGMHVGDLLAHAIHAAFGA